MLWRHTALAREEDGKKRTRSRRTRRRWGDGDKDEGSKKKKKKGKKTTNASPSNDLKAELSAERWPQFDDSQAHIHRVALIHKRALKNIQGQTGHLLVAGRRAHSPASARASAEERRRCRR